jgi:hypothetical protein
MEVHDTFVVTIMPPDDEPLAVRCDVDRSTLYTTDGPGVYKIFVTLMTLDERTQNGVEVEVVV